MKDKELLLKDLCGRLPYGVHLFTNSKHHIRLLTISRDLDYDEQYWINGLYDIDEVKPYLRPMSSMTKEERNYIQECIDIVSDENYEDGYSPSAWSSMTDFTDYCNSRHLDYRNLIGEGLALEAPSDMYKEE